MELSHDYDDIDVLIDTDPIGLGRRCRKAESALGVVEALANELLDAYIDACHQGSGEEPLSSPTWHMFLSTWEEADELIPRARHVLGRAGGGD